MSAPATPRLVATCAAPVAALATAFAWAALRGAAAATTVAPPVLPNANTWLPRQQAELRVLDKIGAQASPLVLAVGHAAAFHSLTLTLKACVVHPPELPADAAAFLDITDSHEGAPGFHGWMFSGEPQLGMLENPLYDVLLLSCQGAPAPPAGPAPELALPGSAAPASSVPPAAVPPRQPG